MEILGMAHSWVYHITAKSLNIAHYHRVSLFFGPESVASQGAVCWKGLLPKKVLFPAQKLLDLIRALAPSPPQKKKKTFAWIWVEIGKGSFLDNADECAADTGYIWAASIMCLH